MEKCIRATVDVKNKKLLKLHINHKDRPNEEVIVSELEENAYELNGLLNKELLEKYIKNTDCIVSEEDILEIFKKHSYDYDYKETTFPLMNFEKKIGFIYNVVELFSAPWEVDDIVSLYTTSNKEKALAFLEKTNPNNSFNYYIETICYFDE